MEEQEMSYYELPLSTPKGSDLDFLLQRLIAGINKGTMKRCNVDLTTDSSRPDWFELLIDFKHISDAGTPLVNPDKARHFG